jgi:molecular chaperone DnaK
VVAIGAAIQAGVLGGEVKDVLLLDVTPLTLGIETLGGVMTPLIERNTTIPDAQEPGLLDRSRQPDQVEIHVLQGERPWRRQQALGNFILDGIPPAPRGVPQIEVTFDIDANGILNVTPRTRPPAASRASHHGLDAAAHKAEDERRREEVEARNQADSAVFQVEKFVSDTPNLAETAKSELEGKIAAVRSAMQGSDTARMRSATDELMQAWQNVGAQMHQAYQQPDDQAPPPPPPGSDEDVVEGEFREA